MRKIIFRGNLITPEFHLTGADNKIYYKVEGIKFLIPEDHEEIQKPGFIHLDILKSHLGEWYDILLPFLLSPDGVELRTSLDQLQNCTPLKSNIFKVFRLCPPDQVRFVFLGQDPYYTPKTANGVAFATSDHTVPPSLRNIFIRVRESGFCLPNPDLEDWVKEGIFLLNTALTTEIGIAGAHTKMWRRFTEYVIKVLSDREFILLGNHAKSFKHLIPSTSKVYEASHPSPLGWSKGGAPFKDFIFPHNFINTKND